MCLDYGRKALEYILRIGRRSSICGAYMQIATTFAFLQQTDSAAFYTDKAIPYLKDYKNVVGENIHADECERVKGQLSDIAQDMKEEQQQSRSRGLHL